MLQDEQDVGNEETDFRIKNLLSWQNILSNRQIAADIEEKWANQGDVLRRGISPIYLSSSNKWKPCHGAINSRSRNLRAALEKYFRFQWNCKQLRIEVRNSMANSEIFSQFSLKLYIQLWKYFHRMILGRLSKGYCKKIGCSNFWPNFLARLLQRLYVLKEILTKF